MSENDLIDRCLKNERSAQKELYDKYKVEMYGVCRRYIKNDLDAEDAMIQGFYKALTRLEQYRGTGNFGGWLRRIMVNESLMYLRKYNLNLSLEKAEQVVSKEVNVEQTFAEQDILKLLDRLPAGYRTVFNLYAIEGFSHKEIAEELGISVNTSKSQLLKARKRLQELLTELNYKVA